LMTYIPMIIGVNLSEFFSLSEIYLFNFFALLSFFITGLSYYAKLFSVKTSLISQKQFWTWFLPTTFIFLGYSVFIFRGNLTLVNFLSSSSDDLYDVRFSGRDIEAQNPLVGYLILWLSGAFLPFIFGHGLVNKNRTMVIISAIGQIILYMTMANKAFILSIFFMWLIYWMLKKKTHFGIIFGMTLSLFTIVFTASQEYFSEILKLIFFPLASLYLVRTIGTSALTSNLYYDFFKSNPHTYYSHVSIINKFVTYPYGN